MTPLERFIEWCRLVRWETSSGLGLDSHPPLFLVYYASPSASARSSNLRSVLWHRLRLPRARPGTCLEFIPEGEQKRRSS